MFRIIFWGLAAALFMVIVCSCAKTTLSGSWRHQDYLQAVKTIYIVGVSRQETNRRIFEDEFGRQLEQYGVRTFSSYRDLDNVEGVGQDLIMEKVRASGADALLMTRILGKRTEEGRLEAACRRALHFGIPSYKGVKNILANRLDEQPLEAEVQLTLPLSSHANVRGKTYYR